MNIPRRKFFKYLTFGTASSLIAGQLWRRDVLAYCEPTASSQDGIIKIRLSDYPALAQTPGSVRLGVNPVAIGDYPDGTFYPFLINRDDGGNFHVLDAECRHEGCVVPTYSESELGLRCPCHGSLYGLDGEVLEGPTVQALYRYPFELDGNDNMIIRIPCWGFETRATVLPEGGNARIRLEFLAYQNTTYEVYFRARLDLPWTLASFATTPAGPANQTSVTTFIGPVSLYLDRATATGFYAVAMKLGEV